jgi:hypothetical protein
MRLCDYGCRKEAKHQFKNGKWCCSKNISGCPTIKEKKGPWNKGKSGVYSDETLTKMSQSSKNTTPWNKNKTGVYSDETLNLMSLSKKGKPSTFKGKEHSKKSKKKISQKVRLTIKKIKNRYPFFSRIEKMRYNPDKPGEKEIQVHCKNHNCPNSKEQGGWFTPDHREISERIRQLERNDGTEGSYFYCSDRCKQECPLYRTRGTNSFQESPYTQGEINLWKQQVLEQDNRQCQKCGIKEDLHCHHIIPVKIEPMFALDPDNGIVLCKKCHYKYGHKDKCSTGRLSNRKCGERITI